MGGGDLEPPRHEGRAAALTACRQDQAGREVQAAVDLDMAVEAPADAQPAHPAQGRRRALREGVAQGRIHASAGGPVEVGGEGRGRISGQHEALERVRRHVGQEGVDLGRRVVGHPEAGVGEARVAARLLSRRALEDLDMRTGLCRGDRRRQAGAAAPDDHHLGSRHGASSRWP